VTALLTIAAIVAGFLILEAAGLGAWILLTEIKHHRRMRHLTALQNRPLRVSIPADLLADELFASDESYALREE
jgi:hypothetical protein